MTEHEALLARLALAEMALRFARDRLEYIAANDCWEATRGPHGETGLMKLWHDGFDAAAKGRAGLARNALDVLAIMSPPLPAASPRLP